MSLAYSRSASLTIGLTTSSHHAFSSRPLVWQWSAFLNIFLTFLSVYSNSARTAGSRSGSERSRVAVLLKAAGLNLWKPMSVSALIAFYDRLASFSGRRLHADTHLEPAGYPALIQPVLESRYHSHYPRRRFRLHPVQRFRRDRRRCNSQRRNCLARWAISASWRRGAYATARWAEGVEIA